jgi:hypothetical protein
LFSWLAQAELSTFSTSSRVLPPSVYLSHQFSFHALGEDYHALIRRRQLDIQGSKLEVRKEVEISAYSAGVGESFVEGYNAPGAVRRISSSFDEPLASALAGGLDYSLPAQPIIPMLPNGARTRPRSFKDSLPIRTMAAGLSDGMTEGLGRIRRATAKSGRRLSSSPLFAAAAAAAAASSARSGSVSSSDAIPPEPLEFDEEDEEDFKRRGGSSRLLLEEEEEEEEVGEGQSRISHSRSRGEGDSGTSVSVSTPSTPSPVLGGDDGGGGGDDDGGGYVFDETWGKWAFDDAERFDDISAVGLFDEEQMPVDTKMRRG